MKVTSECSIDLSAQLLKSILDRVIEKVFVLPVITCYWNEGRHSGTVAKRALTNSLKYFLSVAGLQSYVRTKPFPLGLMEGSSLYCDCEG